MLFALSRLGSLLPEITNSLPNLTGPLQAGYIKVGLIQVGGVYDSSVPGMGRNGFGTYVKGECNNG